jgi:hypothetical protein
MVIVVHVVLCILLTVEPVVARLTFEVCNSMIVVVHMVLGVLLPVELLSATLAGPVTDGIHVLMCGMLRSERALACFAVHHCNDLQRVGQLEWIADWLSLSESAIRNVTDL